VPTLALGAVPGWLTRIMELRIDVDPGSWKLDNELDSLYSRITRPGDRLHDMPEVKTEIPGLVLRYREADGEFYVYLVDRARGRLAGYTVFNRLVEVGRRADPYLRAPHSKYDRPYQRRGLAAAVYRWALDAGQCLITGARQSGAARAMAVAGAALRVRLCGCAPQDADLSRAAGGRTRPARPAHAHGPAGAGLDLGHAGGPRRHARAGRDFVTS